MPPEPSETPSTEVRKSDDNPEKFSEVKQKEKPHPRRRHSHRGCDCVRCVRRMLKWLLYLILCFHIVWGFAESAVAILVNFLVSHEEGSHGFTLFTSFKVVDIAHFEHKEWEFEDVFYEPREEDNKMLKTRKDLIRKCSKFPDQSPAKLKGKQNDKCFINSKEDNENNYFCAIIEHPDKFRDVFKPEIEKWIGYSLTYLTTAPIVFFAFLWQSQCVNLLLVYCILQLIPVLISLSILYTMWYRYRFELCALDYIYNNFPTRSIFTLMVVLKFITKALEIFFILWFIYLVRIERQRRGFGFKHDIKTIEAEQPMVFRDEVLHSSYRSSMNNERAAQAAKVHRMQQYRFTNVSEKVHAEESTKQSKAQGSEPKHFLQKKLSSSDVLETEVIPETHQRQPQH